MQKIPISLAAPEMLLARDVFRNDSPAGIPICGRGTELTASLLSRLQQMGVQSIYVEGHPVWQEGDMGLDQRLEELDKRFQKTADNKYNRMLHEIYRKQINIMMGDQGGREAE